jgi:HK97 family phage prohead protease
MADSLHRRRLADLVDSTANRVIEQAVTDDVPITELRAMRLRWYEMRAATPDRVPGGGTAANVYIYDKIGGSLGVNAKTFAADLADLDVDTIHLRINSPGGSVFDALAIMNTLRQHPSRVVAHIDGIAASAASVVMLGADEIVVEPGGEVMTHNASTTADGQPTMLRQVATWLERQSDNIADLYAQRSGATREQWQQLMDEETWFYGDEAVQIGLADRAETLRGPAPVPDADMAERMRKRHSLQAFRYQGRAAQPTTPVLPEPMIRKAAPVTTTRTARGGVPSEVRDAAQLRRRAFDRRMMTRSAPAGITVQSRRSPAGGDIVHDMVELRGRQMHRTKGYFTVYNRGYEMWDAFGPYQEAVVDGSGTETIGQGPDCIFLVNHTGLALARTGGTWNQHRGTLELSEDTNGGHHVGYLNPANSYVQDLVPLMDDGVITEMSYAFMITDGWWNDDFTRFEIRRYDMERGDVSAVNYGANPYTDISARAAEVLDELESLPPGAIREAHLRLGRRIESYEQLLRDVDPGRAARIADVALESRAVGGESTDDEISAAEKWVAEALGRGGAGPGVGSGTPDLPQDATKVIDNTAPEGPTVASYEALAASIGIKLPQ